MHKTMKTTLAALASLTLAPAAVTAHNVRSPLPGTVTATTYYSSGAFHGAVDIANSCNVYYVHTGVEGSVSWNVTIRTTGVVCNGNGSGNQNEAAHTFADGYTFRQWHFIKTANSYDRTCDRCAIGNVGGTGNATGAHTHLQSDKYGTKDTAWYSSNTSKGEYLDRGELVGYLD